MNEVYPCTIILDRYTGVYSGGKWTAWNMDAQMIPEEIDSDDVTCGTFFGRHFGDNPTDLIYGRGETPQAAYNDLRARLSALPGK